MGRWLVLIAFLHSAAAGEPARRRSSQSDWMVYAGTFTRAPSKGIYSCRFESKTGRLIPIGLAAESENPAFLAVHPNQRFLYAVNEVSKYEDQAAGSISAFSIERASGELKLLNRVSSRGPGPAHLAVDQSGKWLFVANYAGGSVATFPIHEDGTLGEASAFFQHSGSSVNPERQKGPHAHSVNLSTDHRFVLVADLGLDEVFAYRVDSAHGGLASHDPPFAKVAPGSGPRHVAFRPDGKFAYVLNELLSTITAFHYQAHRGSLAEFQTISTLPEDFTGKNSGAEIAVHANGKFLYASNRGHNSIAVFEIDRLKGALRRIRWVPTQGRTPRNFAIDPSGRYLLAANQDSGTVVVFRIDPKSGDLAPTGSVWEVPFPVCITFVAADPGAKTLKRAKE